jgi:hypothetical protein
VFDMTCISKELLQKLKTELADNGYTMGQLHQFKKSTGERVAFLTDFFGDKGRAEFYNNKYERFLLTKQKAQLRAWVQKSTKKGIDTSTTKTLLEKIDKLQKPLNQANKADKELLNGIIKQKLGFSVTTEEAKAVMDKYNAYKNDRTALLKKHPKYMTYTNEQFEEAVAEELTALGKNGVPTEETPILKMLTDLMALKEDFDKAKVRSDRSERSKLVNTIDTVFGTLKSLKATFDASFGRQLSTSLISLQKGQATEAGKAWKAGMKALFDSKENRQIQFGLLMVRPNSLNGNYAKLKLATGIREEAFPEPFEWAGKAGEKASEFLSRFDDSYSLSLQIARANMADAMIELYGIEDMVTWKGGEYINQITGRGELFFTKNSDKAQHFVNIMLFSPRWLMSRVRTMTDISLLFKKGRNPIETARAKTAATQIGWMLTMPVLANMILRAIDEDDPFEDDLWARFQSIIDPRSSDFGKIRVGDTRMDATFGLASLATVASRLVTGKTVTQQGVKKDTTWSDVMGRFIQGKSSPGLQTGTALVKLAQEYAEGEPLTEIENAYGVKILSGEMLAETFLPISPTNLVQALLSGEGSQILGATADMFGVGSTTYESKKDEGKSKDFVMAERALGWHEDRQSSSLEPSKTSSIMTKLSGEKREKAIADFKKQLNAKATSLVKSARYARMSNEEKADALKKVRDEVNKDIKKRYGIKTERKKK